LTKIHAWLLLPILTGWAIARLSWRRAVTVITIWTMTGVGFFLMGWPWLWYDTWSRWRAYWGTSVQRVPIMVEYFGQVLADRDVPWHYPWFYFCVTVPVGLQMIGLYGLSQGWRDRRLDVFPGLLASSIGVFLALFSTRIPIYDGERLFLHVFPAWAMLIGLGFGRLWEHWGGVRGCRSLLALFLLAQCYGVLALHPFGLSYYNLLTGGLPGAEKLGLELTYWSDAVDRVLLEKLAREARPGATAALVPTLYREQGKATTTACLLRRDIVLQDEETAGEAEWLVLSRREAYWRPDVTARLKGGEGTRVAIRGRQGVWLSALWHFPPARSGRDSRTINPDQHRPAVPAPRSGAPAFLPSNAASGSKPP
jgi:hypothetical protein